MLGLKEMLFVALGGACGSVVRYKLSGFVMHQTPSWQFPLGTFMVNVIGCLAIGILGALVEYHDLFSPNSRLLLFTGLLGGFTTFSAFGYETVFLLRRGLIQVASLYIILSLLVGIVAIFGGIALVNLLWRNHH
jgi:CrcB protein